MKPLNGRGEAIQKGLLSAEEALRYAMSLPVATTITGIDKAEVLDQALRVGQNFDDNPEARMSHQFPLGMKQKEVQEMLKATDNTGNPFPKVQ
jgi:hypothetical protein